MELLSEMMMAEAAGSGKWGGGELAADRADAAGEKHGAKRRGYTLWVSNAPVAFLQPRRSAACRAGKGGNIQRSGWQRGQM